MKKSIASHARDPSKTHAPYLHKNRPANSSDSLSTFLVSPQLVSRRLTSDSRQASQGRLKVSCPLRGLFPPFFLSILLPLSLSPLLLKSGRREFRDANRSNWMKWFFLLWCQWSWLTARFPIVQQSDTASFYFNLRSCARGSNSSVSFGTNKLSHWPANEITCLLPTNHWFIRSLQPSGQIG